MTGRTACGKGQSCRRRASEAGRRRGGPAYLELDLEARVAAIHGLVIRGAGRNGGRWRCHGGVKRRLRVHAGVVELVSSG